MDKTFQKFCDEISFKANNFFNNFIIKKVNIKEIVFFNNETLPFEQLKLLMFQMEKNFPFPIKFSLETNEDNLTLVQLKQYVKFIFGPDILDQNNNLNSYFDLELDKDTKICLNVKESTTDELIIQLESQLNYYLTRFGIKQKVFLKKIFYEEKILEKEQTKIYSQVKNFEEQNKNLESKNLNPTSKKRKFFTGYQTCKISDIRINDYHKVIVKGCIFAIDEKISKNNIFVKKMSISDFDEAIEIVSFAKTDKQKKALAEFQEGDWVVVTGEIKNDIYKPSIQNIIANDIVRISDPTSYREDKANLKRIELNVKSQMSTMDGIATPENYIDQALKWEHPAIALLDSNSIQNFPNFYNYGKNKEIKLIYGASLGVIDSKNPIINYASNQHFDKGTYVVFDLETTGLSPIHNEIIEFGAIKIVANAIVAKKQFFIKATKPIPEFIKEITNISDQDVANGKNLIDGLKDILNFFQDATLIAHNANFDISFLNEKLKINGFKTLVNNYIDTLMIARTFVPFLKRFKLEKYAKSLGVFYDPTIAHRADYDANILAKTWKKTIPLLHKVNIYNEKDLFDYHNLKLYENVFSHEISAIAKNQAGLKELFKLISFSHTEGFHKKPTIFYEEMHKTKNILYGSGGLRSPLVNYMFFGTKEDIINEIKKYDYIEVLPPSCFSHFVSREFLTQAQLHDLISFVIHEARKQGKLVVAVSNARYISSMDKLYHEVLINSKGTGGKRHFLFKFNDSKKEYPLLNYLTTNEMLEKFYFLKDQDLINEIVIDNTHEIANMIDDKIEVIKDGLYTPTIKGADVKIKETVFRNAFKKYGNPLPKYLLDRIENELKPIIKYGYSIIYWISHLLVQKSLKDGYLVGSRGSVGSSIIAFLLDISEVNPLAPHYVCLTCQKSIFFFDSHLNSGFDLEKAFCPECQVEYYRDGQNIPFETFLGFNADKVPDIDLNFSGEYQPVIHNEVRKIFDGKYVYRAGTISTIANKTAFGLVKTWIDENQKKYSDTFVNFISKGIVGIKRTTGQHPGGIIVIPKTFKQQKFVVEDFTPVNYPANDINSIWKTTHFDFHSIHDNVLKLDLLGHDDPTALKHLENLTKIDPKTIPFQDPNVIELFNSTKSLNIKPSEIENETTGAMGIPEFGTNFVRRMLKQTHISNFGDLVSISGLSHGTDVWSNNAEVLVKEQKIPLQDLISCRDDIMIFLIQKGINKDLSFTIMERVRKGKSITEEQEKILKNHKIPNWYIDSMTKIKYMFPKAHAVAYVMMAWRIAWFKLYYPEEYYVTYLSTRADFIDIETIANSKESVMNKIKELKKRQNSQTNKLTTKEKGLIPILEMANEAYARGIKFSNVNMHKSLAKKWLIDKATNSIIPPFLVIDGLGEILSENIVKMREQRPFHSMEDFKRRANANHTIFKKLKEMDFFQNLPETDQIELF